MTAQEFKDLFLPCHRQMYLLAFRLTGKQEDAEDLVQETFLRLWQSRDSIGVIDAPAGFCIATLKNLFADSLRRSKLATSPLDGEVSIQVKAESDVQHEVESREVSDNLLKLIDRLPSNQREVMRMRDVADLSVEEIEQATGLSPGNIRTLLCRARTTIRKQYLQLINYERK